jgi:ribokinase
MAVCVLGSLNLDIICHVANLPLPGETILGRGVERLPGGKGANQAIASARHGAATILIGAVGADETGQSLLAALRGAGVEVDDVAAIPGLPTGQAYIHVAAGGENTIVVIGGANSALKPDRLRAETLDRATVFVSQFETPFAVIEAAFTSPAASRGTTILNAAPALADGAALFSLADILVVNQTELARFASADASGSLDSTTAAARRLISRPDQRVVVTLGERGAVAIGPKTIFLAEGRPARVVDTTGAGDCFCGVLAAALSEGRDLREAMFVANAAAALSTQHGGAGLSAPTRTETEAFLARDPDLRG